MDGNTISKLVVIAGAGEYPELVVRGAKAAGVERVEVLALKGSTARATVKAADAVAWFAVGNIAEAVRWAGAQGFDGGILAGQLSPLSLFRGRFDDEVKAWLAELPVKNAHTIFAKLIAKFEAAGTRILPASLFMDGNLPGVGPLTRRGLTDGERRDAEHALAVAHDVGLHDVGQTVIVKSGMVLAVEAFEGTNECIRRAGRLGRGSVLVKAAREGHDMRFDIPVVGLKTLKMMKGAGVTALAFQAGRLIMLDREEVVRYADRHSIAIVGMATGLERAPTRL